MITKYYACIAVIWLLWFYLFWTVIRAGDRRKREWQNNTRLVKRARRQLGK